MRPLLILALVAGCTDVEQSIDVLAEPTIGEVGHKWKCDLQTQWFRPNAGEIDHVRSEPCLAPGPPDAYIADWQIHVCQATLDAAWADGFCGGECDPENLDLCIVGGDQ